MEKEFVIAAVDSLRMEITLADHLDGNMIPPEFTDSRWKLRTAAILLDGDYSGVRLNLENVDEAERLYDEVLEEWKPIRERFKEHYRFWLI